jgi:hypothetical protein
MVEYTRDEMRSEQEIDTLECMLENTMQPRDKESLYRECLRVGKSCDYRLDEQEHRVHYCTYMVIP